MAVMSDSFQDVSLRNPALRKRRKMMNTSKEAVEMHLRAISEREIEAYRQTMNFPFTYQNYNGVALTIEKAADVDVSARLPWEIISSTDPNWHHPNSNFWKKWRTPSLRQYSRSDSVELTHQAMPMGLTWLYGLQLAGMDVGECSFVTI